MKATILILTISTILGNVSFCQNTNLHRSDSTLVKKNIDIPRLTKSVLMNSTYTDVNFGRAKLKYGYESFSADKTFDEFKIILDSNRIAFGDLNNDRVEDAAVLLYSYMGGNHPDCTLCVVLNRNGEPKEADHMAIGSYGTGLFKIDKSLILVMDSDGPCLKYKLSRNKLMHVE